MAFEPYQLIGKIRPAVISCFMAAIAVNVYPHKAISDEANNETDPTGKASSFLDAFQQARAEIESILTTPRSCEVNPVSQTKCTVEAVCNGYISNFDKPYLYQDQSNHFIPNFYLADMHKTMIKCASFNQDFGAADAEAFAKSIEEGSRKSKKAELEFLRALSKNGDKDTFTAFQLQIVEESIVSRENKQDDLHPLSSAQTREDIEAELSRIEKKTGKSFTPDSREKYLRSLLSVVEEMNFLTQHDDPIREAENKFGWEPVLRNPFLNVTAFHSRVVAGGLVQVDQNQRRYEAALERAYQVFNSAKIDLVAFLKKRTEGARSSEIENLIHRIETVQFDALDLNSSLDYTCASPNAFYTEAHSIKICPQLLNFPDAALKTIIYQNLANAISPCAVTAPVLSSLQDKEALERRRIEAEAEAKVERSQGQFNYSPKFTNSVRGDTRFRINISGLVSNSAGRLEIDKPSLSEKIESVAVTSSRYPFASIVDCLSSDDSIQARNPAESDFLSSLEARIKERRNAGDSTDGVSELASLLKAKQSILPLLQNKKGCGFHYNAITMQSQVGTAFSDWLTSELIGAELSKHKESSNRVHVAQQGMAGLLYGNCVNAAPKITAKVNELKEKLGCSVNDAEIGTDTVIAVVSIAQAKSMPWQIPIESRINRIYLANPAIMKTLGCQGMIADKEVNRCE